MTEHTPETKLKMSQSQYDRWKDPELHERVSQTLMGHEVTEETRRKIAEKLVGSTRPYKPRESLNPEHCRLLSKRTQALWDEDPSRFHIRGRDIGHEVNDETRKRISESYKRFWNSLTPEEQQTRISYSLSKCRSGRTFPEELLNNLLQETYPNEWKFVGDGSLILNNRNPDFINIQRRGIIEVFGEYWHDPEIFPNRPTAVDLVNHYKQHNYTCLILWDYEIYNDEALNRIKETFYNVSENLPAPMSLQTTYNHTIIWT